MGKYNISTTILSRLPITSDIPAQLCAHFICFVFQVANTCKFFPYKPVLKTCCALKRLRGLIRHILVFDRILIIFNLQQVRLEYKLLEYYLQRVYELAFETLSKLLTMYRLQKPMVNSLSSCSLLALYYSLWKHLKFKPNEISHCQRAGGFP